LQKLYTCLLALNPKTRQFLPFIINTQHKFPIYFNEKSKKSYLNLKSIRIFDVIYELF
jgi:hypothetical protein